MKRAVLQTILFVLFIAASVQAQSTCVVTGTLRNYDLTPNPSGSVTIIKVIKNGAIILNGPYTIPANQSGVVTLTVPRASTIYLYADAPNLNKSNGVALPVPDAATANLEDLIPISQVPVSGLTIYEEATALSGLYGVLKFVGPNVSVTQSAVGQATVTVSPGSPEWNDVQNKPSSFTPSAHASSHAAAGSDPLTLSQTQITNLVSDLAGKAAVSHTHALAQITDAGTAASKNFPSSGNAASGEVVLGSDTRLTDARTPLSHTHAESEITNLVTDLAAKVPLTRTISTTAPLAGGGDLSSNRTISIAKATGLVDGYIAASDFAVFAAKQDALTLGNVTGSGGVTVTGGTAAIIGAGVALSLSNVPNSALQNPAITINGVSVALGGSTNVGTVTSVGLGLPAEFNVSNSPVTTSGTLTGAWANQTANKIFSSPNGSTGAPGFRAMVVADLPTGIPNANLANSSITVSPGAGLSGGGSVSLGGSTSLALDLSTFINNLTVWDASQASRTLTANLSGATDPVIAFSNNSIDVTTGTLKQGGTAVSLVGHTHAASDIASGQLALARGGTASDLSGTGPGFLKQASTGAAVTVALLSAGDIPDLSATYQPLDADLTAIAALGSTGFAVRTASNTWAQRSIAVGSNLSISNGDGVSGNPTISLGSNVAFHSNNLSVFASTTSAQLAGVISNETGSGLLVFNNSPAFINPSLGVATATSLSAAGLTITGGSAQLDLQTTGIVQIGDVVNSYIKIDSAGQNIWHANPNDLIIDTTGIIELGDAPTGPVRIKLTPASDSMEFFNAAGTISFGDLTSLGSGTTFAVDSANSKITLINGVVSVGTVTPDASAILTLASTTLGFLPPRMSTTERDAISTPAEGLIVHNLTTSAPNFYDGAAWQAFGSPSEQLLVSGFTLDMNDVSLQDVFTVPTGKTLVITAVVPRNPSVDLSTEALRVYSSETGNRFISEDLLTLANSNSYYPIAFDSTNPGIEARETIGAGFKVQARPKAAWGSAATLKLDVFGYLY